MRERGDAALREFTRRSTASTLAAICTSRAAEFAAARDGARRASSTRRSIARSPTSRASTRRRSPRRCAIETMPGVRLRADQFRPIDAVGLYVPAGVAPLPSTAIMLAVPARLAGCPHADHLHAAASRRQLPTRPCSSPRSLCGVDTVFKIGGAQAIAAMAYGTASVPKVDKIFGPGNAWVTAAKQHGRGGSGRRGARPARRPFRSAGHRGCDSATPSSSPPTCWRRPSTARMRRSCSSRRRVRSREATAAQVEAQMRELSRRRSLAQVDRQQPPASWSTRSRRRRSRSATSTRPST